MFEAIIEQVNKAQNIVIFPHNNMDGDSVGSSKALMLAFKKYGKEAIVLADEIIPFHVSFLGSEGFYVRNEDELPSWISKGNYLAFAIDCSDNQRIEERMNYWTDASARVCIDHHPGESIFADITMRFPKSPAAALNVFHFIKELGVEFDKDISEAIYTGILTDTGAFKYSNTDADTHRAVAELLEYGIDHSYICNQVYDNKPIEQLAIEAYALETSKLFMNNKAVISAIPYTYWNEKKVPYSYTESSIDVLRSIKGVEVAAILKEKEPGLFKLSMRAKNYADVSIVAVKLGGGGHKKAAAATLNMPLEEAYVLVQKEISDLLK